LPAERDSITAGQIDDPNRIIVLVRQGVKARNGFIGNPNATRCVTANQQRPIDWQRNRMLAAAERPMKSKNWTGRNQAGRGRLGAIGKANAVITQSYSPRSVKTPKGTNGRVA
jgi:hypothetical protein